MEVLDCLSSSVCPLVLVIRLHKLELLLFILILLGPLLLPVGVLKVLTFVLVSDSGFGLLLNRNSLISLVLVPLLMTFLLGCLGFCLPGTWGWDFGCFDCVYFSWLCFLRLCLPLSSSLCFTELGLSLGSVVSAYSGFCFIIWSVCVSFSLFLLF